MNRVANVCVTLLSIAAVALIGCERQQSSSAGNKKIVIGLIAKSESNPVFQAAHQGARDAALDCARDADCEATHGNGAACVVCDDCDGIDGSKGTVCYPPAA